MRGVSTRRIPPTDRPNTPDPKGRGRPTAYQYSFDEEARQLCAQGATDPELAEYFGVSLLSVRNWRNRYPSFRQACLAGKEVADDRIEDALYQRALGYQHDDVDIRVIDNQVVQTPIRKHYPPDATSMIWWLKNRRPQKWRDKTEVGVTDKDGNDVKPPDMNELARRIAFALHAATKDDGNG